jgi:hypothetical protein
MLNTYLQLSIYLDKIFEAWYTENESTPFDELTIFFS